MADYWVDDGGDGTAGTSWVTAYTTLRALVTAVPAALTTSGNRVFIGHDHVDAAHSANYTLTGPTSGAAAILISCNRTDTGSVPAYLASSTNQIDTSAGAYSVTFDGSFALYGVRVKSGAGITLGNDLNEIGLYQACTLAPAANGTITCGSGSQTITRLRNCVVDLTADGTTNRSASVFTGSFRSLEVVGLTFTNAAYRTGSIFTSSTVTASGCDFSGFTNATACEIFLSQTNGLSLISNCKLAATWSLISGYPSEPGSDVMLVNSEDTDSPAYMLHVTYSGKAETSTVTRTGGASVEGVAASWLVTTHTTNTEAEPYRTPWIYGVVSSTGSKTFTVYIGNNTADLTDAECWLEVESMGDAGGSPLSELTTDQRTITTTAANQTDDTTSTWSSAQTYMQSLAVTATVDQAGLFRARVAVAKASVTNLYVDPKVTVS